MQWAADGEGAAAAAARELSAGIGLRTVVLVEGISDEAAVEALSERQGRSLAAEGVAVVPLGGATSIGRFLTLLGPQGLDVGLTGLCDVGEERYFRQGLERAGLGSDLTRTDMEALGFYVCEADLEDELIRSLGAARVQEVVDDQGDLRSFRTFQRQPAQRERTVEQQLQRFMGTIRGRKTRYARALVDNLDLTHLPRPLDGLLAHLCACPARDALRNHRRETIEAATALGPLDPDQEAR